LRHTGVLHIAPSEDMREVAYAHSHEVPLALRFMLRRLGAASDGRKVRLPSYLLFERGFCRALIDLGYRDVMARRDEIEAFFNDEQQVPRDPSGTDGWDLDVGKGVLTFFGAACQTLQSGTVRDVDVVFGCAEPLQEL